MISGGFKKKQRLIILNMKKEQWINEVFESTKDREKLEVSPFLAETVLGRIELDKNKSKQNVPGIKWAFGLAAVLFIVINVISLAKASRNKEVSRMETQQTEGINNQVIYNY